MTNHHELDVRLSLGAYALGTLEPADQRAVEAHLASCADCLAELAELEPVVRPLSMLTPQDVSPPSPAPSPELFTRISTAVASDELSRARAARRRPSRRLLLVAAAATVLLTGTGAGIGVAVSHHSGGVASTVANGTSGQVHLKVSATDAEAGTRLVLTAQGLPAHEHCKLVARAKDGTLHPAGDWDANYEGAATVIESTDVPRTKLRTLTLYGNGGRHLVTVRL